jgi:flavin-dependent dehydrogenase
MYDVAVVGARCAGSPTAMLLARKGYRVLLVDKATFPSDTVSSHFIHPPGIACLKRWGLLDRVIASNCPPIRSYCLDLGAFSLTGSPPSLDGVATGYAPRRTVLDKILVEAAVESGAELREKFTINEVCFENDRAVGIRGRTANGASVTEKARFVIGADGRNSLVARKTGAPINLEKPILNCAFYTYWSGVPVDGSELYPRDRCFIAAFPTNDDLVCTFVEWPKDKFKRVRTDVEGHFMKALERIPRLAERIRGGRSTKRFIGIANLPNYFRKPHGPGWALVGDAGYHRDPCGAYGISDAFRDVERLTEAVDKGFSGSQPLEEALADYERQRNVSLLPVFELNHQFATLEPPSPEMQALFGALRNNQPDTDRFIGAIVGTVPVPEFFAPANVQRILGAAAGECSTAPGVARRH